MNDVCKYSCCLGFDCELHYSVSISQMGVGWAQPDNPHLLITVKICGNSIVMNMFVNTHVVLVSVMNCIILYEFHRWGLAGPSLTIPIC